MRKVESMYKRNGSNNGAIVTEMVKGALAGAVGVWALDRVVWFIWDRESPEVLEQERRARPGRMDPAHVFANRIADTFGIELTPQQPHPAGIAVHYAIGVLPAALYGPLRKQMDMLGPGSGILLGLGLFLLQDELGNTLLGISGAPTDYPWQAHARGLAGHFVYGVAMDVAFEILDQVI